MLSGSQKVVRKVGLDLLAAGVVEAPPVSLSVSEFMAARRLVPSRAITLPTPYAAAGPAMVHPSVVFVPAQWSGYPYWMAVTPYPGNQSQYENPCILASANGIDWVVPLGVTNPIIDKPAPALAYNSDTCLLQNPLDSSQMILLYRTRNVTGDNRLMITSSRDGWRSFETPVQVWAGTIAGQNDMASPSIWYNAATSKWEIIGHNADAANFPLRKITSSSLLSGWDTTPTALTFAAPSGRAWWHSGFRRLASGLIVGLVQDNNTTVGTAGNIYLAWSEDGATYNYKPIDLGGTWYKPDMVLRHDKDGQPYAECYFNTLLNTVTRRVILRFDAPAFRADQNMGQALLAQAAQGVPGPLWADLFTRADSASAIGTATTGGSYTVDSGVFGISGNRAYGVNAGSNNRCLSAAIGSADHTVEVRVDTVGTQAWVIGRAVDSANYWRLGWNTSSTWRIQSIVAGAVSGVDQIVGAAPAAGDVVRIACVGSLLRMSINGVLVFEVESATHKSGQRVGFQSTGAALTYFDNLVAWQT